MEVEKIKNKLKNNIVFLYIGFLYYVIVILNMGYIYYILQTTRDNVFILTSSVIIILGVEYLTLLKNMYNKIIVHKHHTSFRELLSKGAK